MGRFYCDYCDIYLTHDSQAGRKQHMHGRRHQENVRQYYSEFLTSSTGAPSMAPPMGLPGVPRMPPPFMRPPFMPPRGPFMPPPMMPMAPPPYMGRGRGGPPPPYPPQQRQQMEQKGPPPKQPDIKMSR
uniref:U1 small nuclear ribonucleoprotein C n=1 Tax=Bigelowiella natans TaxID=227086 RepID=Q5YEU6_BIGNA|nr:U1 small nuclear ribonucleoprotein [Bigelowiella natans]|mmetsp:Transcript_14189/g.16989  ORF Transcript_14189/g.16989 Transcript_14189/m.16989 type:complete len:129 (-) Transcript_14189:213-599(-)|eukprot:jgi/Bigna1/46489/estExt_Genewise1.C_50005